MGISDRRPGCLVRLADSRNGLSFDVSLISLSKIYCHPLYATTMEGYGVDINSPEPPFVLFQVLYRFLRESFLGTILYPVYYILSLFLRIASSIVGYLVGFIFGSDGASTNGHEGDGFGTGMPRQVPVSQDDRIPRPPWAPDLSMLNDEVL